MGGRLNVVGAGRVGCTLARLWSDAAVFAVGDVVNSTRESTAKAVGFVGAGQARTGLADMRGAPLWLIGVHDSAIERVAADLARCAAPAEGDVVFHCSGSLGAEALSALAGKGVLTASLHPLKSFVAPVHDQAAFAGTWCTLEGHPKAVETLRPALERLQATVLTIDAANKLLYHAASVFSCNYSNVLMALALRCLDAAGIDRTTGLALLEPLVRGTLDNVFRHGPARALTGPIARGDHRLVARQLEAVSGWDRECARLYRDLGRVARGLAEEAGDVSSADLAALDEVLDAARR